MIKNNQKNRDKSQHVKINLVPFSKHDDKDTLSESVNQAQKQPCNKNLLRGGTAFRLEAGTARLLKRYFNGGNELQTENYGFRKRAYMNIELSEDEMAALVLSKRTGVPALEAAWVACAALKSGKCRTK